MGVKERREREKVEMRGRILEAATRLFVEQGIPNVSIRKIADRIEYSPATIYLYFRDKEHLLTCACRETFAKLQAKLQEIGEEGTDPVACLRKGLRYYIDFGLAHPHHYMLTFNTPHDHLHEAEGTPEFEDANQAGLAAFDVLRSVLQKCQDAGAVTVDDLEATSQAIWTFIHGTTSLLILFQADAHFPWVERERLIERSLDLIVRGLGASPQPKRRKS